MQTLKDADHRGCLKLSHNGKTFSLVSPANLSGCQQDCDVRKQTPGIDGNSNTRVPIQSCKFNLCIYLEYCI